MEKVENKEKIENIKIEDLYNIGIYNKSKDNLYSTITFNRYYNLNITKIILYLNEEKTVISGIEIFYDEISTGIFNASEIKIKEENKIVIDNITKENNIINIYGSFLENKIIKLIFVYTDKSEIGFNNEQIYDITKLRHFQMKILENKKIAGFTFCFNEKELTFFGLQFMPEEILKYNEENKTIETCFLGKKHNGAIDFILDKRVYNSGTILKKITFYNDVHLVQGIKLNYILENNEDFCQLFGKETKFFDVLELKKGEFINKIIIRTGSLVDGVLLNTNENNIQTSGGNGGCPHFYELEQIKEKFSNYKDKIRFIGFQGSYLNELNNIQAIFATV